MTAEEAIKNQEELSKHFKLSFWYGTNCEKCCGVYPALKTTNDGLNSFYECEVCGSRTKTQVMPWIAEEKWNSGERTASQISLF